MKQLGSESGQTLVIVALSMTMLLGFLAFAIDAGILLRQRRLAQIAADAAAVAGAAYLNPDNPTASTYTPTAALAAAAQNGFTNGSDGVTVTINGPTNGGPQYGAFGGNPHYVEAIVSQSEQTFFLNLVGSHFMTVTTRAVATLGNSQNCIYALGSSGIVLNASNGTDLTATSCGIIGNGNLSVVGGAHINAQSIAVAGTSTINNGGSTSPTPATGIPPVSNPLSYLTPPTYSNCVNPPAGGNGAYANGVTLGPATAGGTVCYNYLNIANGATNITLNPGVYVINGNFTLGGGVSVTGTGVTFYFPNNGDTINIANGVTLALSAPTSGNLNGILFWQSSSDTSTISLEGGANSNLQGVIYAPTAPLLVENGTGTNTYVDTIVQSLTIDGGATLKNYDLLAGTSNPIKAVTLVE
ncbi:MAG: pilus assembly protein TadG-related protein [Silvibacterium sp.]